MLVAAIAACLGVSCASNDGFTRWVDPYIGSGGHGHVFVGACVPFGFVQLGPTSIPQSWDWTSGYHISDSTVIGFGHTHLSGTGCSDLGDIALMPVVGNPRLARGVEGDTASGMWSYFSRSHERVRPGYYGVWLNRYDIGVELTATQRTGFHKYTFPAAQDAAVVIDLVNGVGDSPAEGLIKVVDECTVEGYRFSRGWANDQKVFFTAIFSKPFTRFETYLDGVQPSGTELKGQRVYGKAFFDTAEGEKIYVKVALSPVSVENSRLNMEAELPGWDFPAAIASAAKSWNKELEKVKIETRDETVKRTFYTALYHSMIAPSVFCDVNGDYRGSDGQMHATDGFVNYTTFSLWDTYRAAHPLMTIIHPEKMADVINSMLYIYKQQGKLPVWHLMGCETNCMVGNPAIPVVADAILKGFGGFDRELAFEAMKTSAMLDERGLGLLKEYGYIPYDKYNESVATCMEYALADWALAQAAKEMGKTDDHDYFMARSKAYKRYFDPSVGFVRGLSSSGEFRPGPLNPFESVHRDNDYTEGNAWQYTFLVPHDIEGLEALFGSRERFIEKLDSLFVVQGSLGDEASPDISGLIGQYAHGNEPSHHVAYMFAMAGEGRKTADRVREILSTLYHDRPDGLSGNEDVGQMSAWYILSALGFYQVEPAGGRYFFGSPIVDRAEINVGGGKRFVVVAHNNSPENKYIQGVALNGKPYDKNYVAFSDIAAGGEIVFEMGSEPAKDNI